jgi:protein-L-isoaspartate(D-aspartate) O-methyltransferase
MSQTMLAAVAAHYRDMYPYTGLPELPERVRQAMTLVNRSAFIPDTQLHLADQDCALPISCGQSISQPFVVALMTHLLGCQPYHRVLEIGTGSGYQAAVLSRLVSTVQTLEIISELADCASARLKHLGLNNIDVQCADGYYGWPEHAPYDGIMITAAIEHLPMALLEQLRPGGRIVAPLGNSQGVQQLIVAEKQPGAGLDIRTILPVNFVPFTRAH